MKAGPDAPRCFGFYFQQSDTVVEVEETDGAVVIRASNDALSESRKLSFIRELAQEGFIPEDYQWRPLADRLTPRGVRWQVSTSWLMPGAACLAHLRRRMIALFASATLLWIFLMSFVFLR